MMCCICVGADSCMYELIKKGAVVNATNYMGSAPLHYCCQRGYHKAVVSCAMRTSCLEKKPPPVLLTH